MEEFVTSNEVEAFIGDGKIVYPYTMAHGDTEGGIYADGVTVAAGGTPPSSLVVNSKTTLTGVDKEVDMTLLEDWVFGSSDFQSQGGGDPTYSNDWGIQLVTLRNGAPLTASPYGTAQTDASIWAKPRWISSKPLRCVEHGADVQYEWQMREAWAGSWSESTITEDPEWAAPLPAGYPTGYHSDGWGVAEGTNDFYRARYRVVFPEGHTSSWYETEKPFSIVPDPIDQPPSFVVVKAHPRMVESVWSPFSSAVLSNFECRPVSGVGVSKSLNARFRWVWDTDPDLDPYDRLEFRSQILNSSGEGGPWTPWTELYKYSAD